MTVSTEVDHNDYTGNGVTTAFDYNFRIFKKSDLVVSIFDNANTLTVLTLDADYTVTGAGGYTGGKVTLNSPLANGWKISLSRELPVTQETDLRNQGSFFPEVHEDAFDKLTMLIQQNFTNTSLALRKPSSIANFYDAKNQFIKNLLTPLQRYDAANKAYVDDLHAYLMQTVNTIIDTLENGLNGYNTKKSFELGNTLNYLNDVLLWESNGEYYRWDGPLPKVVPPGSTPATTGGVAPGAWRSVGDAVLRSALAAPGGAGLVGTQAGETVQDALTRLNPGLDKALTALYRNQIMSSKSEMGGQLAALRNDLSNPLTQFTGIVLAGDSITWGLSATGIAADSPRAHQLTDARNNSTSNTWANLFHKYIGKRFHHNPTYTQAGWSGSPSGVCVFTYASQVLTYPAYTPVTLSAGWTDNLRAGAMLNRTIDSSVIGSSFSFIFTGFNFDVVFSSTPDSGTIVVNVDGVNVKTINTNSSATGGTSFQVRSTVTLSGFKRNANVTITFTSGSYARIEAIAVNKTTRVTNQGLIGVNSSEYNSILPSAVSAGDIYCFVQLGTNDRASDTGDARSPNAVRRNATGFINYLRANGINPIMCCANQIDLGQITMPSYFQMSEVSSAIRQACNDGLADFVDHMPVTTIVRDYMPFTVSDGLHPNDTGHYLMYMNLVNAIENAGEKLPCKTSVYSFSLSVPNGSSSQSIAIPYMSLNSGVVSIELQVNGGSWTLTSSDSANGAKSPNGLISCAVARSFISVSGVNTLINVANSGGSTATVALNVRVRETVSTV